MTLNHGPPDHGPLKHWPLAGLRLRAPRLEMRLPTLAELDELASLAAEGVHAPDVQPFSVPWTDAPPDERARGVIQFHFSQWGAWAPAGWSLNLVATLGGVIVGTQGISGRDFAVLREIRTGSWLGQRYQGQGSTAWPPACPASASPRPDARLPAARQSRLAPGANRQLLLS